MVRVLISSVYHIIREKESQYDGVQHGKPVNHLVHWAGVHGSLLAAVLVTTLAAGSLLSAARGRRRARRVPPDPIVDASELDNGTLLAYLMTTQDEAEEEDDKT
jgi:hypothetical protein